LAETLNIKEQIKQLVSLQDVDGKIYALKTAKDELPQEIASLQKSFEEKKAHLNSLEDRSKALAVRRKEKELELSSQEENVKKLNSQLFSLKTNKEYQTMLEQIAGGKADNSVREEEILKIMDEQDVIKAETTKEKARLSEEEKKFLEQKKKVEERVKELEVAINDLTAKGKQIIPFIDKRIYAIYERILKALNGLALVKVDNKYTCQGCFISVTSQVVNEIKMLDKLVTCESCARILYLEEDL